MNAIKLLRRAPYSELDYNYLSSLFSKYSRPRQEISRLLKSEMLIRVKKGLYVRSSELFPAFSKEILANLIYGPSYISLEYALSFYGAIPERIEELTCVTCNRHKIFKTPVGCFSYRYLHLDRYAPGIRSLEIDETRFILIATAEKALVDKIWFSRKYLQKDDLENLIFEDLRIEKSFLLKMRIPLLRQIIHAYQIPLLQNLIKIVSDMSKKP
ncbi:MAG: hypothetical protein KA436_12490 [Oligoflexales bacterium]|nr:hypothetical protein [Oligoflexales bacterium]